MITTSSAPRMGATESGALSSANAQNDLRPHCTSIGSRTPRSTSGFRPLAIRGPEPGQRWPVGAHCRPRFQRRPLTNDGKWPESPRIPRSRRFGISVAQRSSIHGDTKATAAVCPLIYGRINMKKIALGLALAFAALMAPAGASADWSLTDVRVTGIQTVDIPAGYPNFIAVTFSAPPFAGCTRFEWVLKTSSLTQDRNLSMLLAAQLSGRTVRVFRPTGCGTLQGVLLGEFNG